MQKKIAAALLFSSALALPALASAEQINLLEQSFANRGACESALKQARNTVRQDIVREAARAADAQGQAGALTNRLANPAIKFVCQAVTDNSGKTVFKIVEL